MLSKNVNETECGTYYNDTSNKSIDKVTVERFGGEDDTKIRPLISNPKFIFMPDTGYGNTILTLTTVVKKSIEIKQDVYL